MDNLIKIFKDLKSTNSVKSKQKILEKNRDNEYLCELLFLNLNPYFLFQFDKLPKIQLAQNPSTKSSNYKNFHKLIYNLKDRKITGNEAKKELESVFSKFRNEEFELYSKILLKKSIGVGSKTVNKVWPNLVPTFDVLLAPNKIPNLTVIKYPCYIQPKLDGTRCIYKDGIFYTRSGRIFPNKNLIKYFSKLQNIGNNVLDGELYADGIKFQDLIKTVNSEDKQITIPLKFYIFDHLTEKEWNTKICKRSYENRLSSLRSILNDYVQDYKRIIDVPTDKVENPQQIKEIYKKYLTKNLEGAMIRSIDGKYQWKRVTINSGEILKLKPFKSVDVKIKDIFEGQGNLAGKAGGISFDYKGHEVHCGTGFNLKLRESLFNNKKKYIGNTVEIKYFEETIDGSLRFPVFERFRPDKDK